MRLSPRTALAAAIGIAMTATTLVAGADTVTIATVNNGDMIRMQKLTVDEALANAQSITERAMMRAGYPK